MKNIKNKCVLLLFICLSHTACNNFGDINIDPNTTSEVAPETLLTFSIQFLSNIYGNPFQSDLGTLYVQHFSEITYTGASRYENVNLDFNVWYTDPLANLAHIISLNSDEATQLAARTSGSNANQIAVARILKAYIFQLLTDRWGPIPYSEALQGRANFKSIYDSQESIYQGIFSELSAAVAQIDDGARVKGDILFQGDMERWKQFANSIRLIAALRLSKVAPEMAKTEFIAALEAGVLTDNNENVWYQFLAETNNENPWFSRFKTRTDYALSVRLIDRLQVLKDARLNSFADPSQNTGDFKGVPYGVDNPSTDPASVSFPNSQFVKAQDAPLPILTYAQILFSQAEAAHLGWITGNAAVFYNAAIRASMEQWNAFEEADFTTYITQPEVEWSDDRAFELIGEQKWIALFLQGYEAWAEWRRIGYPNLAPAPDAINQSRQIPLRQGYPSSERDINGDNWQLAIDTYFNGEDGLSGRLWWDVD